MSVDLKSLAVAIVEMALRLAGPPGLADMFGSLVSGPGSTHTTTAYDRFQDTIEQKLAVLRDGALRAHPEQAAEIDAAILQVLERFRGYLGGVGAAEIDLAQLRPEAFRASVLDQTARERVSLQGSAVQIYDDALAIVTDAFIDFVPRLPQLTEVMLETAGAHATAPGIEQSVVLYEKTLYDRERVLGRDHPDTLTSRNNLARAYVSAGDLGRAIPLHEQTVSDRERVLGPDHPDTLTSRNNLAHAYVSAGDLGRAISLHEQTVSDRERVLGPDHPDTLTSRNNLAHAYVSAGDLGRAISLHEQTVSDRERVLGPDHPDTLTSRNNLAHAYVSAGDLGRAISLHEQTVSDRERVLGPDHPDTLTSRNNLAHAYQSHGDPSGAAQPDELILADGERVTLASSYEAAGRSSGEMDNGDGSAAKFGVPDIAPETLVDAPDNVVGVEPGLAPDPSAAEVDTSTGGAGAGSGAAAPSSTQGGPMPSDEPGPDDSANRHAVPIADVAATQDRLGMLSRVEALARLICAESTKPPLAVALLAQWGGGKSSFMTLLEKEIRKLADDESGQFHDDVHVVTFNAWHYSDTHVLLGMVREVFQSLSTTLLRTGTVQDGGASLEDNLARRQVINAAVDDLVQTRDSLAAGSMVSRSMAFLRALREMPRILFGPQHPVRRRLVWVLFTVAIVASFALFAVAEIIDDPMAWINRFFGLAQAVVLGVPGAVLAITICAAVRDAWKRSKDLRLKLVDGASWVVTFVTSTYDQEIERLRAQLGTEEDSATGAILDLAELLQDPERAAQRDAHRGVVGLIQDQLKDLAVALGVESDTTFGDASGIQASPSTHRALRLDRLVLHVDDLDRCQPERVVEVLQAVNLLQSTRLFVVVVSVDPRWLRRSLERYDRMTFDEQIPVRAGDIDQQFETRVGDPLDFLDKIFQIPYTLPALNPSQSGRYLDTLVTDADLLQPGSASSIQTPIRRVESVVLPDDPAVPVDVPQSGSTPQPPARPAVRLTISATELAQLSRFAGVLTTPRTVKRYLNLYQLLRLGPALAGSTEDWRPAALLLALVVGAPRQSTMLLAAILDEPSDDRPLGHLVIEVANRVRAKHRLKGDQSTAPTTSGDGFTGGSDAHLLCRCEHCQSWERITAVIADATADSDTPANTGAYRPWVAEASRYSFYAEALGVNMPQ